MAAATGFALVEALGGWDFSSESDDDSPSVLPDLTIDIDFAAPAGALTFAVTVAGDAPASPRRGGVPASPALRAGGTAVACVAADLELQIAEVEATQEEPACVAVVDGEDAAATPPTPSISFAVALRNAERVKAGRGPAAGAAWRGCGAAPWCNRGGGHAGPCNTRATIPGLAAYSDDELTRAGVAAGDFVPPPARGGARGPSTPAAKRARSEGLDDGRSSAAADTVAALPPLAAADDSSVEGGSGAGSPLRAATASPSPPRAGAWPAAAAPSPAAAAPSPAAPAPPVSVPTPAPPPKKRAGGRKDARGRRKGGAPGAARPTGVVAPGQQCTQCGTQATPVWRAGPAGPKTLCNACGVRYMKQGKKR